VRPSALFTVVWSADCCTSQTDQADKLLLLTLRTAEQLRNGRWRCQCPCLRHWDAPARNVSPAVSLASLRFVVHYYQYRLSKMWRDRRHSCGLINTCPIFGIWLISELWVGKQRGQSASKLRLLSVLAANSQILQKLTFQCIAALFIFTIL